MGGDLQPAGVSAHHASSLSAHPACVTRAVESARAALPESNGRIDKAQALLLAGDVEQLADGRFAVGSQSSASVRYVVGNTCDCPDAHNAPGNACKHVIASWVWRKARAAAEAEMRELDRNGTEASRASAPSTPPLPEAPASANCYVEVAGRKLQVTLCDVDEGRLLNRLEQLLARFPSDDNQTTLAEGWCAVHSVQMTHHSNDRGSWWSHKTDDDKWCRGRAS